MYKYTVERRIQVRVERTGTRGFSVRALTFTPVNDDDMSRPPGFGPIGLEC